MKKNKTITILIVYLLLSFCPVEVSSQGYKVKNMKVLLSDISASTKVRHDSLGVPCGLVKILVKNSQMKFSGNVVGGIDNKMNEYWVYLSKGSKNMFIKPNDALPFRIDFGNYGVDEIESKVTYQLLLDYKPYEDKNAVVINVVPRHAVLAIDNYAIDERQDGSYRLYLPKGEHVCKVDTKGYRPSVEILMAGKGLVTKTIQLESLMAQVKVGCQISDTKLYVDGKQIGVGSWEGQMPAGMVRFEARKEGYAPSVLEVKLTEKGNHEFVIPSLKQLKGSIMIVPDVTTFNKILIDGFEWKVNGTNISDISSGKHILSFCKYGYNQLNIPITVGGNGTDTVSVKLTPTVQYEEYLKGNINMLYGLGERSLWEKDYQQADYWLMLALQNVTDKDILFNIARIYENKKNTEMYSVDKAQKCYERTIELNKLTKDDLSIDRIRNACYKIGDLYKKAERYSEAINWYKKGEQLEEIDNEWVGLYIGDCYYKIGDFNQAKQWYTKASKSSLDHIRKDAFLKLEMLHK